MSRIPFVLYLQGRPVAKVIASSRAEAVATHARPDGVRVATLAPWVRLAEVCQLYLYALPADQAPERDCELATDYTLAALADAAYYTLIP